MGFLIDSNFKDFIFMLFAAAYTFGVAQMFLRMSKRKQVTKKETDNFYEVLIKGLEMKTINSLEDVYNIYKGINDYDLENENYRYSLNKLLRKFLVKLQLQEVGNLTPEQIKEWKDKIDVFIQKNEELSPFSEIPQAERGMMNDILAFLDTNDTEAIRRKLIELSSTIQLRKEELDKIEKLNKWSIPLAVVGLFLTIIFGIASLV